MTTAGQVVRDAHQQVRAAERAIGHHPCLRDARLFEAHEKILSAPLACHAEGS
jgi:hypothetical protein